MKIAKCLTTIESSGYPEVSRVERKQVALEKQRVLKKIVIWSDLHGDMQRSEKTGVRSRLTSNEMSSDIFLGLPYNIASYALLTHMIGKVVNMIPDTLVISIGNAHVYKNHINQSLELLSRDHAAHDLCELKVADKISIDDFTLEDFEVIGYKSYPAIKAEVAV